MTPVSPGRRWMGPATMMVSAALSSGDRDASLTPLSLPIMQHNARHGDGKCLGTTCQADAKERTNEFPRAMYRPNKIFATTLQRTTEKQSQRYRIGQKRLLRSIYSRYRSERDGGTSDMERYHLFTDVSWKKNWRNSSRHRNAWCLISLRRSIFSFVDCGTCSVDTSVLTVDTGWSTQKFLHGARGQSPLFWSLGSPFFN